MNIKGHLFLIFSYFLVSPCIFASSHCEDIEERQTSVRSPVKRALYEELAQECEKITILLSKCSAGVTGTLRKAETLPQVEEIVRKLQIMRSSDIQAHFDLLRAEDKDLLTPYLIKGTKRPIGPAWVEANDYQLYFYHVLGRSLFELYNQAISSGFRNVPRPFEHIPGLRVFEGLITEYKRILSELKEDPAGGYG